MLLALASWWGGRLRFEVVMGLGRALVAAGRPEAASRVYGAEIERCERRRRALAGSGGPAMTAVWCSQAAYAGLRDRRVGVGDDAGNSTASGVSNRTSFNAFSISFVAP